MFNRITVLLESARIAVSSIRTHKMRAFLTLLGIIVGVASVMVVGAGITGLKTYVTDTVSKTLGSDSFVVSRFMRFGHVSQEEFQRMVRRNKKIELSDIKFIRRNCPDCGPIAGEIGTTKAVYFGSREVQAAGINGVTAEKILLGNQEVAEGQYFTSEDVRRSRAVCVIGADIQEKLFPNLDPIGRYIKVQNHRLRVVGILEELGSSFGQSLDMTVDLPITTFQKMFGRRSSIQIRGTSLSKERFDDAVAQVRTSVRVLHKLGPAEEDDFGLTTSEDINSLVEDFTQAIANVIVPITLISLLVGGIVVMNIMLVSVTERTFEIGLRKSLGARKRDILTQFLIEAFLLAALGGGIGLSTAIGIAWIIEQTTPMTMTISLTYIVLSISVSGGIGVLFGLYPAFKASQMDPIEALRQER